MKHLWVISQKQHWNGLFPSFIKLNTTSRLEMCIYKKPALDIDRSKWWLSSRTIRVLTIAIAIQMRCLSFILHALQKYLKAESIPIEPELFTHNIISWPYLYLHFYMRTHCRIPICSLDTRITAVTILRKPNPSMGSIKSVEIYAKQNRKS